MKDRVFRYLQTVPRGRVVTYGQIAAAVGHPGAARAVGNILHRNPDGDAYPCYRVVSSRGALSEHYAFGGLDAQRRRLEADGVPVIDGRVDIAVYGMQDTEVLPLFTEIT